MLRQLLIPLALIIGLVGGYFAGQYSAAAEGSPSVAAAPTVVNGDLREQVRQLLVSDVDLLADGIAALSNRYDLRTVPYRAQIYENPNSPVAGNVNGDVVIVEFLDYNCIYCKRFLPVLEQALAADANIKVIFKEMPILHESSKLAAIAALAANRQGKYMDMHKKLIAGQGPFTPEMLKTMATDIKLDVAQWEKDIADPALAAVVDKNQELAMRLGFRGTPSLIVGNQLIPGFAELPQLQQAIAEARAARTTVK